MYRFESHPITIASGKVWIIDPYFVFGYEAANKIDGLLVFSHPYITKDGEYAIYSMNGMYFVNIHPQTLRVKNFPDMTRLPDKVPVDVCSVGFIDYDHSALIGHEEVINRVGVLINVNPGKYYGWFEQKGKNLFRGVIGFGDKATRILNGKFANEIANMEKDVVQVMRKKGNYKTVQVALREAMLNLHQQGCRDIRLWQIAKFADVTLPSRSK